MTSLIIPKATLQHVSCFSSFVVMEWLLPKTNDHSGKYRAIVYSHFQIIPPLTPLGDVEHEVIGNATYRSEPEGELISQQNIQA